MEVHANGHDGIPHVHGCPDHPNGSEAGGSACFWHDDHDDTFKSKHNDMAVAGLTRQYQDETHPEHKTRIKTALEAL